MLPSNPISRWIRKFVRRDGPGTGGPCGSWVLRATEHPTVSGSIAAAAPADAEKIREAADFCSERGRALREEALLFEKTVLSGSMGPETAANFESQRRSLAARRAALGALGEILRGHSGCELAERINQPIPKLGSVSLLAFHVAARDPQACRVLLSLGADPNRPERDGSTPVGLAEERAERAGSEEGPAAAVLSELQRESFLRAAEMARAPDVRSL